MATLKKPKSTNTELTSTKTISSKKVSIKPTELIIKVPEGAGYGTGRRKESVARVWVFAGTGKISINNVESKSYLHRDVLVAEILSPLRALKIDSKYDIKATTKGGGMSGQAGALKLGIGRALLSLNEVFKKTLREEGALTRDMRTKERKKYGRRGARKGAQYRKR